MSPNSRSEEGSTTLTRTPRKNGSGGRDGAGTTEGPRLRVAGVASFPDGSGASGVYRTNYIPLSVLIVPYIAHTQIRIQ